MSVKYLEIFVSVTVVLMVLANCGGSYALNLKDLIRAAVLDSDDTLTQERSWNLEGPPAGSLSTEKRSCAGFPCVYTNIAERAGRASLQRYLAHLIDDCMQDPSCSMGRRRKRSLGNNKS